MTHQGAERDAASVYFRPSISNTGVLFIVISIIIIAGTINTTDPPGCG